MKFSHSLLLSLILTAACGGKHEKKGQEPLLVPTVEPSAETKPGDTSTNTSDTPAADAPLLDQLPAGNLQKLRDMGCTITNEKGVVSCAAPANLEAGDALDAELRELTKNLHELDSEKKISPELFSTWILAQFEATFALEDSPAMAPTVKAMRDALERVDNATGTRLLLGSESTYSKNLEMALRLDGLCQSADFVAQIKRLQISKITSGDKNQYLRLVNDTLRVLVFERNGDAATFKSFVMSLN